MAFMANKINFQKELDKLLEQNQCEGRIPSLFLHSCCAPCSSYVIKSSRIMEITMPAGPMFF